MPTLKQKVRFTPDFGQRSLLTVEVSAQFGEQAPLPWQGPSLGHVRRIAKFQQFCETIRVTPVYLVDWPMTQSEAARDLIRSAVRAGKAEIGLLLGYSENSAHKDRGDSEPGMHFAATPSPRLEREKIHRLRDAIEEHFGAVPRICRAERFGLGPHAADVLADTGIAIDSSIRSHFDFSEIGGPNYSHHPVEPYWTDGEFRLIELPPSTVYWGMLRKQGTLLASLVGRHERLAHLLPRMGLFERIPLTPEGVSVEQALRGIDIAIDDGLPILVLRLHSASLEPGTTPYVRDESDLDALHDWLREVYAYLGTRGVQSAKISEIMEAVVL